MTTPRVWTVEQRVLDGPNLYYPRPAVKLTLEVPGWMRISEEKVREVAERLEMPPQPVPGRARQRATSPGECPDRAPS